MASESNKHLYIYIYIYSIYIYIYIIFYKKFIFYFLLIIFKLKERTTQFTIHWQVWQKQKSGKKILDIYFFSILYL